MNTDTEFNKYDSSGEQLSLFLNLDGFEGPIDLLLHLSREQKVDLVSISITELANQYISFIERVKFINIEYYTDNISNLLSSAMMTGYFLRQMEQRKELEQTLKNDENMSIEE